MFRLFSHARNVSAVPLLFGAVTFALVSGATWAAPIKKSVPKKPVKLSASKSTKPLGIAEKPATGDASAAPPPKPAGKRGVYTESIPGSLVTFEMVPIPPGTYTYADPAKNGAKTKVKVGNIWMGKTEVTWNEMDVYAFRLDQPETRTIGGADAFSRPSYPYGAPDRGFGHKGYPAISLSYLNAETYCKWLSAKTGKTYRLPTEAEWEYACHAGSDSNAPADKTALGKVAWYFDNSDDKTHPVGQKEPNAWGLYDMLGNAGEWATALTGPNGLRGGAWNDDPADVSCASRKLEVPAWQATDPQNPKGKWWRSDGPFLGFRIVREAPELDKPGIKS